MSVIKTITDEYYFWNWLKNSDGYSNNFSLEGSKAVFNYFEDLSEQLGNEDENSNVIEFDPIAWCCEFAEYDNALEAAQDYGYEEVVDLEPHGSVDLLEVADLEENQAREWLEDRTTVLQADNGHVIVGQF